MSKNLKSKAKLLMIQGTSSGAGKNTLVMALCRIFSDMGLSVSPFKSQNMSSNIYTINQVYSIARIQALQSIAARKTPDRRLNPIVLVPQGNYESNIYIDGKFYKKMQAFDYYKNFVLQKGFPIILDSLESLRRENDLIIIEGAGSPAEINIERYDVANMLLAKKVNSPVLLISDIERGGCFANIVGTLELIKSVNNKLIKGFVINKFRGDPSILKKAITKIERKTGKRNIGTIPKLDLNIPNEDSLDGNEQCLIENKSISPNNIFLQKQIDYLADQIKDNIKLDYITKDILKINK